ncbi:DUF6252 family protein [Nonlabens xiamenensis]|uniref:DUF6252 family protein n=1 Tax=Nonlabens xiamenensis TaxID=2341043 RepID=UPI000F60A3D0|nr:DUF6252 family protein [Nonlabens xiamenensis]
MKSLFSYLLVICSLSLGLNSCSDNLDDDNVPALQAVRNGEFFKSNSFSATSNNDGSLTIIGQNPLETVLFNLNAGSVGTYRLGAGSNSEVNYIFNGGQSFSSNVGNGRGEVELTEVNASGVTGNFSFVSYLPNNADSLYMRQGVIFKVPFGSPIIDNTMGGTGANTFRARIDGTALNPTQISPNLSGGELLINASNGPNTIGIILPVDTMPGSYNFGASGDYIGTYVSSNGTISTSTSGNLVITAADSTNRTISGTFEFTTGGPNNFQITEGMFTVNY